MPLHKNRHTSIPGFTLFIQYIVAIYIFIGKIIENKIIL